MRFRSSVILLGLAVATTVPFVSRTASACSCAMNVMLSPADKAVDVPLNAVVVFESVPAPTVYDETRGVDVAVTAEPFPGLPQLWLVRPNAPWAPTSTFRLSPSMAPGAPGSRFSTGTTTDHAAPVYAGLTSFRVETTTVGPNPPCRSSCWSGEMFRRLRLEYEPPQDATLLLLEIRGVGADGGSLTGTVALSRYFSASWPKTVDTGGCVSGIPAFVPTDDVCARIVAFDAAGHRSESPTEICSRAMSCEPRFSGACTPLDECLPPPTNDAGPDAVGPDANPDALTPDADPDDAAVDAVVPDGGAIDAAVPPTNAPDVGGQGPATDSDGPRDSGCAVAHVAASPAPRRALFAALIAACALGLRRLRRRD